MKPFSPDFHARGSDDLVAGLTVLASVRLSVGRLRKGQLPLRFSRHQVTGAVSTLTSVANRRCQNPSNRIFELRTRNVRQFLRLVYVSNATGAADQDVLQSILERSTARNKPAGVTGVL